MFEPISLDCPQLPVFAPEQLETVSEAFRSAPACSMRQAWRREPETDFAPGIVRVGWRDRSVLIFAELSDADIFSHATRLNQRTWELGDAFEIFLRPEGQESYREFQVTPNNQRLQLRFADAGAVQQARNTGSLQHALVPGEAFHSRTWGGAKLGKWFVFAEVPAASVCDIVRPLADSQWRFSFSRYDYTRGRKGAVISSTSPHAKADFHRQEEWGTLNFHI